MININKVKTYSLIKRKNKVSMKNFAHPPVRKASFMAFYRSLPNILKVKEFNQLVEAVVRAKKKKKAVVFMAGAHVIKCGLNPVVIELMRKGIITCICLNGAGIIHDFELALQGKTSEDVGENLKTGRFGMAKETAGFINQAINSASGQGLGLALAKKIAGSNLRYKKLSLLYQAYKYKIPVYVFVAIGADIIHQHPSFDGSATGRASQEDFYQFTQSLRGLNDGGVLLNFGSAVVLPEVFLKALNLCRNLGFKAGRFTTANFDMIYHYRPLQNVVLRPVSPDGKGYYIIGHHELLLPLLAQAVIEKL